MSSCRSSRRASERDISEQYPRHDSFALTKFELTTSKGLGIVSFQYVDQEETEKKKPIQTRKMGWYGIAGGTGVVSLPA